MGGVLTRLHHWIQRIPEMRILMQGLDGAGKTTILYKLKLGEVVTTIPTIGFNVESVELNNASLTVWDCGGRGKIRPLWKHYMANTDALIWVVDSTDRERIDSDGSDYDFSSSRVELHKGLLEDDLRDAVVLVFATKQDVAGAMTPAEVSERLGLSLIKSHPWHVQGCNGKSGEGLYEGLQWMTEAVKRQMKIKPRVVKQPVHSSMPSPEPISGPPPEKPVVTRLNPPPVSQRRKLDAISSDNPEVLAVKGDEDLLAPAAAPLSPGGPVAVPNAPPLSAA